MTKHPMLCRAFAALVLSSAFVGLSVLPALSQREDPDGTAFLFDGADCVTSGSHNQSETIQARPNTRVPINRQIYDLLFVMQATNPNTVTLSCRTKKGRSGKIILYGTIVLEMGIPDISFKDSVAVKVDTYQGGNLRYSYNDVRPGTMIKTVLDLDDIKVPRNPDNFSIEMSCNSTSWCYLDFVTAKFYPGRRVIPVDAGSAGTAPSNVEIPPSAPGTSRQDAPAPNSSRQDPSGSSVGGQILEKVINGVLQQIFK